MLLHIGGRNVAANCGPTTCMKKEFELSDRREFLVGTGRNLTLFAALASGRSQATQSSEQPPGLPVGFERYQQTDPKLITYEEISRRKSPHPEPRRIAAGHDGEVYVCSGNHLTRLNGSDAPEWDVALAAAPTCVAVAGDGGLYVGLRDHVEVFDSQGRLQTKWELLGKRAWLTALAVGESEVFAADSGNRVVLRFDRSGKLRSRLGQKDPDRHVPGFVVPSPHLDIVIARDGLLRINNLGRHRVEAYTFDGDFEGAWGKPSLAVDGFGGCCNPISLALLPDGCFVTCEKGLPRVKIYSSQGEFESVVAGAEAFPENARACSSLSDCTRGGMDATVDSKGRIYILDYVAGDIRVMQRKALA